MLSLPALHNQPALMLSQILLRGHDMPVQSVAVSQSGRFIATGQALSPHKGMFQVFPALNIFFTSQQKHGSALIEAGCCSDFVGGAAVCDALLLLQIIIWDYSTRQALFQAKQNSHALFPNLSPLPTEILIFLIILTILQLTGVDGSCGSMQVLISICQQASII